MNQGTFAFYDDQVQQAGMGSTVSSYSASCTGTASVTGQQTTTTATGGLWRWGDGVVTDPSTPDGDWAELEEWIRWHFNICNFYYRTDNKELNNYFANRANSTKAGIIPGNFLRKFSHKNDNTFLNYIPVQIIERLFFPIQLKPTKSRIVVVLTHRLLFKIYRKYDSEKLPYIDHMNGDSSCNLVSNLRPVTAQQNAINSAKNKASIPGVRFNKSKKKFIASLFSKGKEFLEESDAVSFRRLLLQEEIASGYLEEHDLWAFDKRVETALAYRRDNNRDAFNRPVQAYSSPVAPINPSDSVTYLLPPAEPIQPRFNTLWYRPAMSVV